MCLLCHQNMSDETIKQQILESLEDPKFEVWNSTSISHLTISLCGFNGYEVSDLSYRLFTNYISYLKDKGEDITNLETLINMISNRSIFLYRCVVRCGDGEG